MLTDWADPHGPLFCPRNFLLSCGIHVMANVDVDTWVDALWAADIIKACYMEVTYERKFGAGSREARMAATYRMAVVGACHGSAVYTSGGSYLALQDTPDGMAGFLPAGVFSFLRRVGDWLSRAPFHGLPGKSAGGSADGSGQESPAHKREWWG